MSHFYLEKAYSSPCEESFNSEILRSKTFHNERVRFSKLKKKLSNPDNTLKNEYRDIINSLKFSDVEKTILFERLFAQAPVYQGKKRSRRLLPSRQKIAEQLSISPLEIMNREYGVIKKINRVLPQIVFLREKILTIHFSRKVDVNKEKTPRISSFNKVEVNYQYTHRDGLVQFAQKYFKGDVWKAYDLAEISLDAFTFKELNWKKYPVTNSIFHMLYKIVKQMNLSFNHSIEDRESFFPTLTKMINADGRLKNEYKKDFLWNPREMFLLENHLFTTAPLNVKQIAEQFSIIPGRAQYIIKAMIRKLSKLSLRIEQIEKRGTSRQVERNSNDKQTEIEHYQTILLNNTHFIGKTGLVRFATIYFKGDVWKTYEYILISLGQAMLNRLEWERYPVTNSIFHMLYKIVDSRQSRQLSLKEQEALFLDLIKAINTDGSLKKEYEEKLPLNSEEQFIIENHIFSVDPLDVKQIAQRPFYINARDVKTVMNKVLRKIRESLPFWFADLKHPQNELIYNDKVDETYIGKTGLARFAKIYFKGDDLKAYDQTISQLHPVIFNQLNWEKPLDKPNK